MRERKQSFLERLTGTHVVANADSQVKYRYNNEKIANEDRWPEAEEHDVIEEIPRNGYTESMRDEPIEEKNESFEETADEAGLAIDMYQSDNELVIQTMIAGVTPENLHLTITRDAVILRGRRVPAHNIPEKNYWVRELYWGNFSREIALPFEIDTDGAEAVEKYGLLTIRLPRLDAGRVQELKVKSIR